MEKMTLFWLFVSIFAATAIITLLGITGVIKNIKEKYLNTLFTALILEVVAAVVLLFQGFDFNEKRIHLAAVIQEAGQQVPPTEAAQKTLILEGFKKAEAVQKLENQIKTLESELAEKEKLLADLTEDREEFDKSFYSNITKLDNAIDSYRGENINIGFQPEEKESVYLLLVEIFSDFGLIRDGDNVFDEHQKVNKPLVRQLYTQFRNSYGRTIMDDTKVYIDKYDVSQMVKRHLEGL